VPEESVFDQKIQLKDDVDEHTLREHLEHLSQSVDELIEKSVFKQTTKLTDDTEEYTLQDLLQHFDDRLETLFEKLEKQDEFNKLMHKRFREHSHDPMGRCVLPYEE